MESKHIFSLKTPQHSIPSLSYASIREDLIERREIAIIDVREEAPFAEGHPLFAANIPYSRLETQIYSRVPRRDTRIVVYDNGEGLANVVAGKLLDYGYTNVYVLKDGLKGWENGGGEIFIDVNSPSKAFGEWVESKKHTPSLSASEVQELIDSNANIVVLDARRYDEYHTMSIPTGISVPGAELVLRAGDLVPDPRTRIIVNCAGRTRSIIGTQSLLNAGLPNPVSALRNGTIGWTLAGQNLETGQDRTFNEALSTEATKNALLSSRKVADLAGVKRINLSELNDLAADKLRTLYRFDVRSPAEYLKAHLKRFISAPGGQLVQETDHYASVRGARIVLADDKVSRANMTASWLAQMGWEVYVIDKLSQSEFTESGPGFTEMVSLSNPGSDRIITREKAFEMLNQGGSLLIVDFSTVSEFLQLRIPGAWFALRSELSQLLQKLPEADQYILTSRNGTIAKYAYPEFQQLTDKKVYLLQGGNESWAGGQMVIESGGHHANFASSRIDRYQRPYEGTSNSKAAMQAYLDWEYGLVAQLERDATHFFKVI